MLHKESQFVTFDLILVRLKSEQKLGRAEIYGTFLATFSLRLLQRCLKLNKVVIAQETKEDRRQSSDLVEPIVTQVLELMNSGNNDLMQSSLEIISHIISWPIYCVRKNNRKMLRLILKVIETNDVNDLNIIQSCFKMIRRILKANRYFLAPSQISEVLHSIREHLYSADWVNEPLHCLNLLISIKLMKPEIYDLFDEVFGLMITVKHEPIKKLCMEISLNFIQNYPMSDALLDKIILKLVNNLDFAEHEGRRVVLTVFQKLIDKVPLEAFNNHLDTIILGFTARMVNEQVSSITPLLQSCFTLILTKVHEDPQQSGRIAKMFDNCLIWVDNPHEGNKRAGLQLLKLLFHVTGEFHRIEPTVQAVIEATQILSDEIVEFWDNVKVNDELRDTLKDNMWRDVFWEEGMISPQDNLSRIKDNKRLVLDYLSFIQVVLCHPKCKYDIRLDLFALVMKLSRHPDEDVQYKVLEVMSLFFKSPQSKSIIKEQMKSVLLTLFANVKSKHLHEQIIPFLTEMFHLLVEWFGVEIPKIKSMIITAISSINFKYLKFNKRYLSVVNKCMAVIRTLNDILRREHYEPTQEEVEVMLTYFVRMADNGFIREDKEAIERIEAVVFSDSRTSTAWRATSRPATSTCWLARAFVARSTPRRTSTKPTRSSWPSTTLNSTLFSD